MEIKLSELRKVKGIGPKAMERVQEHLDKLEGDKAYVSEYDPLMHVRAGDLVRGDMLDVMNGIPDKSVDMILTDLPYGTTACSWDSVIPFDKVWKQYSRVIKDNGAIVLFGSEPFSSQLRNSNIDNYKYDLVWDKGHGKAPGVAKYRPMPSHETLMIFGEGTNTYNPQWGSGEPYVDSRNNIKLRNQDDGHRFGYNGIFTSKSDGKRYPLSVLNFNTTSSSKNVHPTQKPVALLEYLIKTYTNENEVVLDSTMGSGSTGVAAYNTNRQFIGIELDEEYFKIATERIKESMNEQK